MFILGYGTRVDGARVQQLILEEQPPSACDSVERSRSRSRYGQAAREIGSKFGILLIVRVQEYFQYCRVHSP